MNPWTILQRLNGMLVVILLAGCGGAPATPPSVSSAVTPTQARDATGIAESATVTPAPTTAPTASPTRVPAPPPPEQSAVPPTEETAQTAAPSAPSVESYYNPWLQCQGEGSPTVVLEHGMGDDQYIWSLVWPDVAQFTRVCSYTRPQQWQVSQPHTSEQIVDTLHAILDNEGIAGPYVLVGHSIGGFHVRVYTDRYPEEVAGMVLVDSSHEDQHERLQAVLPPTIPADSPIMMEMAAWDNPELNPEGLDIQASAAQVRASRSLGDMPLVVLTHGRPHDPAALGLPDDVAAEFEDVLQALQQDLAQLSTNSTQIIAEEGGHYIHQEQPDVVVDAIRQLVEAARER